MAPMNYKADAEPDGEKYNAGLNLSMPGPWSVNVRISIAGKTVSTRFTCDVN
jgi:hypothetical protein